MGIERERERRNGGTDWHLRLVGLSYITVNPIVNGAILVRLVSKISI